MMRENVGVPEGLGIYTAGGRWSRRTRAGAAASVVGARLSLVYLLCGGLALVCYLRSPVAGSNWLFELTGLSATVAIAVGVVRYRPRPVVPWVLFIVAQLLFVSGDFFYYTYDLSFPSAADALYIGYYPLQAAGLVLLIRTRTPGRDSASLLDALIITVGLGLLSWIYLIEPYTRHLGDSVLSRLVSMAYPAMDVLLLAVAARLVMGSGSRPRSFQLLTASILLLVVTDVVYGAIELNGSYTMGSWLDLGWMGAYVLWGAAALHPSMTQLSARAPATGASLSGRRILLLAAATLIAPATLVADQLWPIDGFDVAVAAGASAVLFALVLVRMLGLVASLREAVGRHQRAERRETALRRAAMALAAAPDREHIRRAAVAGARDLFQGPAGVEITVEISADRVPADDVTVPSAGTVVIPLHTQASLYGRLVVTSRTPVPTDVMDGLRTLGAQVALALESAALSDGLSRQRSEARVGALVQNSSDVIMVLDGELVIRYVTPSVARVLGHRPDDVVGTPLTALVEPSDHAAVTRLFSRLSNRPGKGARAEWRMRRGDGRVTDVEAVSTDLLANPSVHGIIVTARDVTERKALEVGLKRQVNELEKLDRIRTEFVATVSHELRTPLTSIIGEVELLSDGDLGDLTDAQAAGVEVIGRNSARLLSLIDDLLTLSHMETNALSLHRAPTSVSALVDGVRGQVAPVASAKSVALVLDSRPGTGSVVVDAEQLDRALLNLLTNAVKFTPPGGTVTLAARREGEDVLFAVSDTGVGIPEDEQDRLFTRFFRSSVATRLAIQGTGLGLVIVKQIVEEHGGTISVVSTPGAGTTVTIRLPAGDVVDGCAGAA
ncbi:PAS domain-containing sensor histidine kinase [Nocardioides pocheonensis]|uniref:histidine kinase n=1 Tax=Nocardioides pocheonensis TaxID=661485 RepID=A0A3N0GMV9_9ACTN|nr:ATP-binding protein [Nocardioides pocheonensis]RNM13787.1 PAS domain S-box protein [Nocardioides pocheonensis]